MTRKRTCWPLTKLRSFAVFGALLLLHVLTASSLLLAQAGAGAHESIGVCWGRIMHQPIPPSHVVALLKENNVTKVKLFDTDAGVLAALANSDMEVTVMVRNEDIEQLAVDEAAARDWVYLNLVSVLPTGVDIRFVSVGNEPFLKSRHEFDNFLLLAVQNIQKAIERADLQNQIKVMVAFNMEIIANSHVPSNATFEPVWVDQIKGIAEVITKTGSVFSINIYPFFVVKEDAGVPLEKAFFDGGKVVLTDKGNGKVYYNLLDASLDALISSFTKIGFPDIDIMIGEAGWPTDGDAIATVDLAARYHQGLVKHIASGKGTPLRPGYKFVTYLFALFDEDAKAISVGAFERRWGLYDDFGRPKYKLDLSGNGDTNAQLPTVPNLAFLPKRWCIVDPQINTNSLTTMAKIQSKFQTICKDPTRNFGELVDCSPVTSQLVTPGYVCTTDGSGTKDLSYVLNGYFQVSGQDGGVCTDGGLGKITKQDPSYGNCKFSIGLDEEKLQAYDNPSSNFTWQVLAYIVSLILALSNFL